VVHAVAGSTAVFFAAQNGQDKTLYKLWQLGADGALTAPLEFHPKLVLSGHAASLTPYQSDTPRPSPRQYALLMRGVYLIHTEQACLHPHEDSVPGGPAPVPPRSTRALTPPAPRAVKRVDAFGMAPVDYAKGEALSTLNMITGHKAV
jgi:hypothetical protein